MVGGRTSDTEAGLAFKEQEAAYLSRWKQVVNDTVWVRPPRPAPPQPMPPFSRLAQSLLTGAAPAIRQSPAVHPTDHFPQERPGGHGLLDYGYTVVPSQSDKDDQGRLLDDPFDPRTEWLVEIPRK